MYRTLLLLAALVVSAPAMAQGRDVPGDERAGTASATFLLVPTTARTTSLANGLTAGLSTVSGLEGLQSNPATLMNNTDTEAMFSYINFVADVGVNTFGVAQNFGNSNVALFVTAWDLGEIALTTAAAPDPTTVTYDASTFVVGATYARQFTDRIAAGVTAKAVGETIDDVDGSAVAFDAGVTYSVGESGLEFGVSLRNFGTKMSYSGNGLGGSNPLGGSGGPGNFPIRVDTDSYELPSLLNFGASYTRQFAGDVSVTALGNFRSNAYDQPEFAGGLELGYGDLFYVRGGANVLPDSDVSASDFWSLGAGVNLPLASSGIGVDYAFRSMGDLGDVNLITASLRF